MDETGGRSGFTFDGRARSVGHAIGGISLMIRTQHNAWIHAVATLLVILAGIIVKISIDDWCWMTLAIIIVWITEALNTSFEFLCDVVSPDFHPHVKQAKDIAAGAVLISAFGAVVIGMLVLGPPMLLIFS
ncbi:MAG: diacylglycerol kinase family protein [Nitrospirota bacterium]|nr:diacylglycerol kinase family protein [Nitrospirota bacterium]